MITIRLIRVSTAELGELPNLAPNSTTQTAERGYASL